VYGLCRAAAGAQARRAGAGPGSPGRCPRARAVLPPSHPPAASGAGRWTAGGGGRGRLVHTSTAAAARGTKRARQRRGQHLSLLARPPLFSAEAAAAANCHGHQVTGPDGSPEGGRGKDGRNKAGARRHWEGGRPGVWKGVGAGKGWENGRRRGQGRLGVGNEGEEEMRGARGVAGGGVGEGRWWGGV
jgi:hypothetical protein